MGEHRNDASKVRRRDFLKIAGAGLTASGLPMTAPERARAQGAADRARQERIASCTWPIRQLFKTRGGGSGNAPLSLRAGSVAPPSPARRRRPANRDQTTTAEMKQRYGEITMLDFPQWTKDNFPGVTRMDMFSGLFGDVTDDTHVHDRGRRRRRRRRLQSDEPVRPEVAGPAREHAGEDRHEGPAHLEQRAVRPRRLRIAGSRRAAQGRRRDGQALARGLRGARRRSRCA